MNKRFTAIATAAVLALSPLLVSCADDNEDDECESAGTSVTLELASVEQPVGATRPPVNSGNKPGTSVKIDDDLFEECDD